MEKSRALDFNSIEEFLDYLPEEELKVVLFLRKIILECMPDCKEKLVHNVPFYYRHSRICYIWPAWIPWVKVEKGVAIGFCKNSLYRDEPLEATTFSSNALFTSIEDIDVISLKQQLNEAILIDEQIVKARRRRIQ